MRLASLGALVSCTWLCLTACEAPQELPTGRPPPGSTIGGGGGGGGDGGSQDGGGGGGDKSISGTLRAPADRTLAGTVIVACVLAEEDCDVSPSGRVTVTSSDDRAAYTVSGLGSGPFVLRAYKDANGNGTLDTGDLVGAHVKADGTFLEVTAPATGIDLELSAIPAPQSLPAQLQGTWRTSNGQRTFSFRTDGTYTEEVRVPRPDFSECIATSREGVTVAAGSVLTLHPTGGLSATYETSDCSGTAAHTQDVALSARAYTWSVTFDTGSERLVLEGDDGARVSFARAL